jgi:hypothetical protein
MNDFILNISGAFLEGGRDIKGHLVHKYDNTKGVPR